RQSQFPRCLTQTARNEQTRRRNALLAPFSSSQPSPHLAAEIIVTDTSASLLERLRVQPDAASWERLVQLYTPLLRGWLGRGGIQGEDADDLVQDIMTVLVRELPHFRYEPQRGSFRGWLRTITVNRLRVFWRSRQSRPVATGDSNFADKLKEL